MYQREVTHLRAAAHAYSRTRTFSAALPLYSSLFSSPFPVFSCSRWFHSSPSLFSKMSSRFSFLSSLDLSVSSPVSGVFSTSWHGKGSTFTSSDPSTNHKIADVVGGTLVEYEDVVKAMEAAKAEWSNMPMPVRGEIVRQIGDELRKYKAPLGRLVSLEMGKIESEGLGEVQEAIDICDYAVGLSRTLAGQVLPSERPGHFMMERWNPLKGHVAIITAFNFPCAVYFWNAAISMVCGNTNLWKPSETGSLVAIACIKIVQKVLKANGIHAGVATMIQGEGKDIGEAILKDPRIELVSFTGSERVGKRVSEVVSCRFGKRILELGGNNAVIIMDDADLSLALRGTVFSAVGTAGQRCTSLRRLYLHEGIYDKFLSSLLGAYKGIKIGDPLEATTLCGPLHNKAAVDLYKKGIAEAKEQGGKILCGGRVLPGDGNFVEPTLVEISPSSPCVQRELFAPVLYVMKVKSLDEAIAFNNSVPQGLSSSLFTSNPSAMFQWTGPSGSDCGIVNVNIGPSGAEIGGAFGGEKSTGGGRESGSDSWKQYMRRSTCTINHSKYLPLAQGIKFDI